MKIIVEGKDFISLGEELNNHVKVYEEKLGVKRNGEYFPLGTLVVGADLRPVYNHSVQNILFIFFLQLVKSTAVSIVILILLNIFLIKNLEQIFTYLKGYDFDKPNKPLSLKGKAHLQNRDRSRSDREFHQHHVGQLFRVAKTTRPCNGGLNPAKHKSRT